MIRASASTQTLIAWNKHMHIEEELKEWLTSNISDKRQNKARYIEAVLNYYGFGKLAWPTLEEIGIHLSIGTRERV